MNKVYLFSFGKRNRDVWFPRKVCFLVKVHLYTYIACIVPVSIFIFNMAVVESHIFSRMRGSIGDTTFCQSQWNPIVARKKIVNPAYPDTPYQQYAKASFSYALARWILLAAAVRLAWELYAKTLKTRKPFGESEMTGRMAFIQTIAFTHYFNTVRGVPTPLSDECPTEPGVLKIGPIAEIPYTDPGSTGVAITITNPNDYDCLMFAVRSVDLPITRNRFDGPFQGISALNRTIPANSTFDFQKSLPGGYDGKACFHKMRFCPAAPPYKVSPITIIRGIGVTNP